MSSIPGYRLEDYLMWEYNLVVEDEPDANISLAMAEVLDTITPRTRISQEKFLQLVNIFDSQREYIENMLDGFEEETMSWRDYAGSAFDHIPESISDLALVWINER